VLDREVDKGDDEGFSGGSGGVKMWRLGKAKRCRWCGVGLIIGINILLMGTIKRHIKYICTQ